MFPLFLAAQYEDGVLELRIAKKLLDTSKPEGKVIQVA